jgi:hypothetical protein
MGMGWGKVSGYLLSNFPSIYIHCTEPLVGYSETDCNGFCQLLSLSADLFVGPLEDFLKAYAGQYLKAVFFCMPVKKNYCA